MRLRLAALFWLCLASPALAQLPGISVVTNIPAAGTNQATGTLVSGAYNYVATGATCTTFPSCSGQAGVTLTNSITTVPGASIAVVNEDTAKAINIWPPIGQNFDLLAVNAPYVLPANSAVQFSVKSGSTASRSIAIPNTGGSGGGGGSLSGMTGGYFPVANGPSSINTSLPPTGTSPAQVVTSTSGAKTAGHVGIWDGGGSGNLIDGGPVPLITGMTANQVPLANGASSINSSLPTSGTTPGQVATATTGAKTSGHLAVWDSGGSGNLIDGGPVPAGSGSVGGMTSGQIPVANGPSTINTSLPTTGTSPAKVATATGGTLTAGHAAIWDSAGSGNLIDGGVLPTGTINGMTSGYFPVANGAASINSSLPATGSGPAQVVTSTTGTKVAGHLGVWDPGGTGNLVDGGALPAIPSISGMNATQVPIANGAASINTSLPTTGTSPAKVATATSGTVTNGHLAVWDSAGSGNLIDGGAVPAGSGSVGGMIANQIPVANGPSSINASLPTSGSSPAQVATATSGAKTAGHLATWDSAGSGNLVDGGAVPTAGSISGMTAGSFAVANGPSSINTSLPPTGTSPAQVATATSGTKTAGHLAVWDTAGSSNLIDGGLPSSTAETVSGPLTAAGTNQAGAAALTSEINLVTTAAGSCPTGGPYTTCNGMLLSAAWQQGDRMTVCAKGAANGFLVYPDGTGTIGDNAAGAAVRVEIHSCNTFRRTTSGTNGQWVVS